METRPLGTSMVEPSVSRRDVIIISVLLAAVSVLNTMDRTLVSVLAEPIKAEFHLSDTKFGLMSGLIFGTVYTVAAIPLGRAADWFGYRRALAGCLVIWSAATTLSGAASTFVLLVLARIAVALGEAGATPSLHSLVGRNLPASKRSRALGTIGAGHQAGVMLALIAGGMIAGAFGWRRTFYVLGVPGIVVGALVFLLIKDAGSPSGSDCENQDPAPPIMALLRTLSADRSFLLLMTAAVLILVGASAVAGWKTAFAMRSFHLPLSQAGLWLGLASGVGGIVGTLLGGVMAAKRDSAGIPNLRTSAICVMVGCAAYLLCFAATSAIVMMVLLTAGAILTNTWYAPTYAALQAVVPDHSRARSVAVVFFLVGSVGIGGGPFVTGWISDLSAPWLGRESLRLGLAASVVVLAAGGIAMALSGRALAGAPRGYEQYIRPPGFYPVGKRRRRPWKSD